MFPLLRKVSTRQGKGAGLYKERMDCATCPTAEKKRRKSTERRCCGQGRGIPEGAQNRQGIRGVGKGSGFYPKSLSNYLRSFQQRRGQIRLQFLKTSVVPVCGKWARPDKIGDMLRYMSRHRYREGRIRALQKETTKGQRRDGVKDALQ